MTVIGGVDGEVDQYCSFGEEERWTTANAEENATAMETEDAEENAAAMENAASLEDNATTMENATSLEDNAAAEDNAASLEENAAPEENAASLENEATEVVAWYVCVGVLGTGVPKLACLWPTTQLHQRPCTAHIRLQTLKTLARGQASRGGRHKTSSGAASPS